MTDRPFIILLNGPPGAGKDTVAEVLEKHGFVHEKMAHPLYKALAQLLDVDTEWLAANKNTAVGRGGKTVRQLLIDMSENYVKPRLGDDWFGWCLRDRISAGGHDLYVVSDCGFNAEVLPVVEEFGRENVALFWIDRPGHTFDGDSREWVGNVSLSFTLRNWGSQEQLQQQALVLASQIMGRWFG